MTRIDGGPGIRVRLWPHLPVIEGGRSTGWWGLTLGEGGDGEGGGGREGLHQTADKGAGVATHYDEAKVWGKGIGKCVWGNVQWMGVFQRL